MVSWEVHQYKLKLFLFIHFAELEIGPRLGAAKQILCREALTPHKSIVLDIVYFEKYKNTYKSIDSLYIYTHMYVYINK